jgi:hypothetical protein
MVMFLERKTRVAAIQWTGSNLSEIEDFVDLLPKLDSFYDIFTGISVTNAGSDVTISWSGGTKTASQDWWITEGLRTGSIASLVDVLDGDGVKLYRQVTP